MTGLSANFGLSLIAIAVMAVVAAPAGQQVAPSPAELVLPEGEGREILKTNCTVCHSLDRVVETDRSREGWEEVVYKMIDKAITELDLESFMKDEEIPVLLNYLVRNFGTD